MIEYRDTCTECPEETYDLRKDLTECPHCMHPLKSPIEITEESIGIIAGRPPTSKGLRQKLD